LLPGGCHQVFKAKASGTANATATQLIAAPTGNTSTQATGYTGITILRVLFSCDADVDEGKLELIQATSTELVPPIYIPGPNTYDSGDGFDVPLLEFTRLAYAVTLVTSATPNWSLFVQYILR